MKCSKSISAALLISGTAIGAGMLALPVVTGVAGFLPASLVFLICYLFSVATGLLLFEVCLYMPNDSNLVSMAGHLMGPLGRAGAWVLYLFLFYCLNVAYVTGGGNFVARLLTCPIPIGILLFTLCFGTFVFMGTRVVARVNWILMVGLGLSFFAFIAVGIGAVQIDLLKTVNWAPALFAIPVIFTSFSYQGIIPSLSEYLDRDPKKMRFAILVGTAIPFVAYLLWEGLILGLVPVDLLVQAKAAGQTDAASLNYLFPHSPIYLISQVFGIFALTTSFLGVTLGLLDFLADGLRVKKVGMSRLFLCAVIYLPPIAVASLNPTIFFRALGFAGGIGCALLLGFYPALMAYYGRYRKGYAQKHIQLPGGKGVLYFLMICVAVELVIEVIAEAF
ncbi:MAG: tyrosine transporter [Simkaniaceae bacterium]|nr:tyrosine transporter [Simkaniaceae bacterium]